MAVATRIFIGFAFWLVSMGISTAAGVPTERVTAPRSMESIPGISVPPDALDKKKSGPESEKPAPGAKPEEPADQNENSTPDETTIPRETVDEEEDVPEIPEIHYGEDGLPGTVRQMRRDILEAAKAVDFDRLRLILDANEPSPTLSFGETGDPIEFLKQSSGDPEGLEILAILIEVLQAGWVHKNPGEPEEMFVWPYFAEMPLDQLSDSQKVELFKIVSVADLQEMEIFGTYIFYRLGIGLDGTWYFFVTGD